MLFWPTLAVTLDFSSRFKSTCNKATLKSLLILNSTAGRRHQAKSTWLDFGCASRLGSTYWGRLPGLLPVRKGQVLPFSSLYRTGLEYLAVTLTFDTLILNSTKLRTETHHRCTNSETLVAICCFVLKCVTLNFDPVTLTFDPEQLWCTGCAVVERCTKVELNRAILGGFIAVWTLTLWPWTCTTCCAMLWDTLHKV